MTPREELLAAVAVLNKNLVTGHLGPIKPEALIVRDWLQLEADQHWHISYVADQEGDPINKWDLVYREEWVAMQPCIQMARLINGTEGP